MTHCTNSNLKRVIKEHRDDLINRICNKLQKMSESHYEIIDFERHQEREEEFLDIMLKVIADCDDKPLIQYMENLANKRSNEGYTLEEVQKAIRIFENEFWSMLTTCYPLSEELVELLTECNRAFAVARDNFAKYYVSKTLDIQNELNTLKERFYIYKKDRKDFSDDQNVY